MKLLTLLFLFNSSSLFANEQQIAKIVKRRGQVTFKGRSLRVSQTLSTKGTIKTGARSFVKLTIPKLNSSIVIGPNSQFKLYLTPQKGEKELTLLGGSLRWLTTKIKKKVLKDGVIHTRQASIGVRGTDYYLIQNPLLGETEIVCLDGKVLFTNQSDTRDKTLVSKGQWGGLGGRYGEKIGKILDLPPSVIKHFNSQLKY